MIYFACLPTKYFMYIVRFKISKVSTSENMRNSITKVRLFFFVKANRLSLPSFFSLSSYFISLVNHRKYH